MPFDRMYDGNGAYLPYNHNVALVPSEQLYDGIGALLTYKQIVAPMLSEGMYGGIRKKSIGYPRNVYRVSEKSL